VIDRNNLTGSIDFIGTGGEELTSDGGRQVLDRRSPAVELKPDPNLPDDTRLWSLLQQVSGGTWGGCVYDVNAIEKVIHAGIKALRHIEE